jgi:hypothetical protein
MLKNKNRVWIRFNEKDYNYLRYILGSTQSKLAYYNFKLGLEGPNQLDILTTALFNKFHHVYKGANKDEILILYKYNHIKPRDNKMVPWIQRIPEQFDYNKYEFFSVDTLRDLLFSLYILPNKDIYNNEEELFVKLVADDLYNMYKLNTPVSEIKKIFSRNIVYKD